MTMLTVSAVAVVAMAGVAVAAVAMAAVVAVDHEKIFATDEWEDAANAHIQ